MVMKFIRNFKEIKKENISIAGGKGASLGEMTDKNHEEKRIPTGLITRQDY